MYLIIAWYFVMIMAIVGLLCFGVEMIMKDVKRWREEKVNRNAKRG